VSWVKPSFRFPFALAAASVAIGILYATPQLLMARAGGAGGVAVLFVDELAYEARLQRVLEGHWTIGDPWVIEHAKDPSPIPSLAEDMMAVPFRAWGALSGRATQARDIVPFLRPTLAMLGLAALTWALVGAGVNRWSALLAALWAMADPGVLSFKPFGPLFGLHALEFARFSNPLLPISTFFLAWGALARASSRVESRNKWALLAGALAGLHLCISVYYWSHLLVAAVLSLVLIPSLARSRAPLMYAVGFAALAIPYALAVGALRHRVPDLFAWRIGMGIPDRGFYTLHHRTLWASTAIGFAMLWRFRSQPGVRVLLGSIAAGLALYISPLLTGRSFQQFHWHYTIAPLVAAALVYGVTLHMGLANRPQLVLVARAAAIAAAAGALACGVVGANQWTRELQRESNEAPIAFADRAYAGAWEWLRKHAATDAVVLSRPESMTFVPLRTGLWVWTDSHLAAELVSAEEARERSLVMWALLGVGADSVQRVLCPRAEAPVAQWPWGMTKEEIAEIIARGSPPVDRAIACELACHQAEALARLRPADVVENARGKKLDYVVVGPFERTSELRIFDALDVTQAYADQSATVYEVHGWKPQNSPSAAP
jgi:hypothetical protein